MINFLAFIIVILAGFYLLVLSLISFLKPDKASGFLLGFASSASFHYLELFIRIVIGTAFVVRAPLMNSSEIFSIFGWVLIGTTTCLFIIPWHWHRKFARQVVPRAIKHLKLVAICSMIISSFIIISAVL